MPTVREYTDDSGYYICANIDGDSLILQLTAPAEGLLTDLGYHDDHSISWALLSPLCESGDVYVSKSGTEVSAERIESLVDTDRSLTDEEAVRLEGFLNQRRTSDSSTGSSDTREASGSQKNIDPRSLVDEQSRHFIEKWTETEDEYITTLNRIPRADDPEGITKSVRQHGTHHPISPQKFEINSVGVPVYIFETGDVRWTISHFEPLDAPESKSSIIVEIRPGKTDVQSIRIGPGVATWDADSETLSAKQIDDFLSIIPDVSYFINFHTSSIPNELGEIIENPDVELSKADRRRVQAVQTLEADELESNRQLGVILSQSESGNGRLRSHLGHTLPYDTDDITSGSATRGTFVSLETKEIDGGLAADEIRIIHTDTTADPTCLLTEWPQLREASIASVRNRVTSPEDNRGVLSADTDSSGNDTDDDDVLSVGLGGEEQTTLRVSIPRGVYWALQTGDNDPAEVVDEAVRGSLKQYIDGSSPDPVGTTEDYHLRVTLPKSLLTIIETTVETTPVHDSIESFLTAALTARIDSGSQEFSVRLSGGEYTALKHLATVRDQTVDDLVAIGVESVLVDAPELSSALSDK